MVNNGGATGAVATITRVSVSSSGAEGNSSSYSPAISSDGSYVAFSSYANNLVEGDTNGRQDIFIHDTQAGITTRVSVNSSGAQGNNDSYTPSISADGRMVAFSSDAGNLVSGDTNGWEDIFVHDRQTGLTTRVSVSSTGAQNNDASFYPSISPDGRYVTFSSYARNLVSGDTNNVSDIFVHDRQTGLTSRVSVDSAGDQSNGDSYLSSISADGRYVAFYSCADNLMSDDANGYHTDVFMHDRQTGNTSTISVDSAGSLGDNDSYDPTISADGRYILFTSNADNLVSGDTNNTSDVFMHDTLTGATTRVSVNSNGQQGNGYSRANRSSIQMAVT